MFYNRPSRIFNQAFGNGLLDVEIPPIQACPMMHHGPVMLPTAPESNLRPKRLHSWKESGISDIRCTKDNFELTLDVSHFKPEEVTVKTTEDGEFLIVQGKHEEKEDSHGFISREFRRRYHLPPHSKTEKVVCNLSSDGMLRVDVPRVPPTIEVGSGDVPMEKVVPIKQTGKPAAADPQAAIA